MGLCNKKKKVFVNSKLTMRSEITFERKQSFIIWHRTKGQGSIFQDNKPVIRKTGFSDIQRAMFHSLG